MGENWKIVSLLGETTREYSKKRPIDKMRACWQSSELRGFLKGQ